MGDVIGVFPIQGTFASTYTVGTAAVTTNRGVFCHPKATDGDLDAIEDALGFID